jgi:hypothetical protein
MFKIKRVRKILCHALLINNALDEETRLFCEPEQVSHCLGLAILAEAI